MEFDIAYSYSMNGAKTLAVDVCWPRFKSLIVAQTKLTQFKRSSTRFISATTILRDLKDFHVGKCVRWGWDDYGELNEIVLISTGDFRIVAAVVTPYTVVQCEGAIIPKVEMHNTKAAKIVSFETLHHGYLATMDTNAYACVFLK